VGNNANPTLIIQQNLPEHIKDLEAELAKIVGRMLEIQKELTTCRTLQLVTPVEMVPEPTPTRKPKGENEP
jgi:hypothetical protein